MSLPTLLSATLATIPATKLATKFAELAKFAELPKAELAAAEFTATKLTKLNAKLLAEVLNGTLISVFRTTRRAPCEQRPSDMVCPNMVSPNLTCTVSHLG